MNLKPGGGNVSCGVRRQSGASTALRRAPARSKSLECRPGGTAQGIVAGIRHTLHPTQLVDRAGLDEDGERDKRRWLWSRAGAWALRDGGWSLRAWDLPHNDLQFHQEGVLRGLAGFRG